MKVPHKNSLITRSIHRYHPPWRVGYQIIRGSTLIRALFNETIRSYEIGGDILDLGSKSSKSEYYKYIHIKPDSNITYSDLVEDTNVIAMNIEETFPFSDGVYDVIIAFHLFEHVFNYNKGFAEAFRVLKPGGTLIVAVPFMHKYHPDPDDFFRFTDSALKNIGEANEFVCCSIEYVGEGIYSYFLTTAVRFSSPRLLARMLAGIMYSIGTILDRIINWFQRRKKQTGKTMAQLYALEHIVVFKKPMATSGSQ